MKGKGECNSRRRISVVASILLISTVFILFVVTPVIAQPQPVEVTVNASEYIAVEEETFTATIDVDSVTDFSSGNFDLCFDSSVVKVSEVKEGEINGEEIPIYMWRFMDSDTVRVAIMLPIGECVSGSGYLAEIEFDVEGEEGKESELSLSGRLYNISAQAIPANWTDAKVIIGVEPTPTPTPEEEEGEDEEESEEVTPGSPNITSWNPVEAVVNNIEDESRTFNVTVNQIADISWQINGTEVQTNDSTREAVFTNASAVIGTWNVSAIATNITTGLSDMHTWIWSVTSTAITPTPTPTLAPRETSVSETGIEETPKPQGKKTAPKEKPTPVPAAPPTPTPKPKPPGFEAILAIGGMLTIAYILLLRRR